MERQQTVMEDAEDLGLRAVMGPRFRDLQQEQKRKPEERPRRRVRNAAGWAGTLVIFGWWLHTGQMEPTAAIPGMVLCAALVGYHWGKQEKGR